MLINPPTIPPVIACIILVIWVGLGVASAIHYHMTKDKSND